MHLQSWIKENRLLFCILLISSGIFFFALLWYLFPDLIYDQFIWKYFWGPILSDGLDKTVSYNGVDAAPKFTLVSEIVYGIVVASGLFGIFKILKKWKISVDFSFFLGLFPFILYGSVARTLEDAQLFTEPLVFWFVTPLIYIQILILTLATIFFGVYITQIKKISNLTIPQIMGIIGSMLLAPLIYYVLVWMSGNMWSSSDGLFPNVFFLVFIICLTITIAFYGFIRFIKPYWYEARVFSEPINLLMIFGHQLDGVASYISIFDPLKLGLPLYVEKHPASDFLLQLWPPLFPIVKFFLIIGIIYVLDVLYKEDLQPQKRFVSLLKIGIFILGFGPGLRDLLRVMMGV